MCLVGRTANEVQIHKLFFIFIMFYQPLAFTVLFICFDKTFKDLPKDFAVEYNTTYNQLEDLRTSLFALAVASLVPMIVTKYYDIKPAIGSITPPVTNNI